MAADGSNRTALTSYDGDDSYPVWSPDGTKIAFHTDRDGNYEIYSMDADGQNQTNLTNNPAGDYDPAWSPDGSKIVFDSFRNDNLDIYAMNADGSDPVRITTNEAWDEYPSWSVATSDAGGGAKVGPGGGTVVVGDGTEVVVPPGTFSEEVSIIYTSPITLSATLPNDQISVRSFSLEAVTASGIPVTSLTKPVTITLNYASDEVINASVNEQTLGVLILKKSQWEGTGATIDQNANQVGLSTNILGDFVLVGQSATQDEVCVPTGEDTPEPQVWSTEPSKDLGYYSHRFTVNGKNFVSPPMVFFRSQDGKKYKLRDISAPSGDKILGNTPLLPVGIYDVVVQNPDCDEGVMFHGYEAYDDRNPVVDYYFPDRGRKDMENTVEFFGFGFEEKIRVTLGDSEDLQTTRINDTNMWSLVAIGLDAKTYDVTIQTPDGRKTVLTDGYTVFEVSDDDLFGYSSDFWTEPKSDPPSVPANQKAQVGLVVHRHGAADAQPWQDVKVAFSVQKTDGTSETLGTGIIPMLGARNVNSTGRYDISWTPTALGKYTLVAEIDPNNDFKETKEDNNTVTVDVTVREGTGDQTSPVVTDFSINNGATETDDRNLTLNTEAEDTGGSGVDKLFYVEYEYSEAAALWLPVNRTSDWLPYDQARTNYQWEMRDTPGMKYMQAWAKDGNGNMSIYPIQRKINYAPAADKVARDQARVYRYDVKTGQTVSASVEPQSGDPDLYIWPPNPDNPPYVSNLDGMEKEEYSFQAKETGSYQVEVYGYQTSEYRLVVQVTNTTSTTLAALTPGNRLSENKDARSQPSVPVDSVPSSFFGGSIVPDTTVQSDNYLFLPLIQR